MEKKDMSPLEEVLAVSYTHLDVYKRQTVVTAVIVLICTFFGVAPELAQELDQWSVVSGAVVCAFGLVNLTSVHMKTIKRKGEDWDLSIVPVSYTHLELAAS